MLYKLHSLDNVIKNLGASINSRFAFLGESGVLKGFKLQSFGDLYGVEEFKTDVSLPIGDDTQVKEYTDATYDEKVSPYLTTFAITSINWVDQEDMEYSYFDYSFLSTMSNLSLETSGYYQFNQSEGIVGLTSSALINYHGYTLDIKFIEEIEYQRDIPDTELFYGNYNEVLNINYLPKSLENSFNEQINLRKQLLRNSIDIIDLSSWDKYPKGLEMGYYPRNDTGYNRRLYWYGSPQTISFFTVWLGVKYNSQLNKIETRIRTDIPLSNTVKEIDPNDPSNLIRNDYSPQYMIYNENWDMEVNEETLLDINGFLRIPDTNTAEWKTQNHYLKTFYNNTYRVNTSLVKLDPQLPMFFPVTIYVGKSNYVVEDLEQYPVPNSDGETKPLYGRGHYSTGLGVVNPNVIEPNPIIYQLYEKVFDIIEMKTKIFNTMFGTEWVYIPIGVIFSPPKYGEGVVSYLGITNDPFLDEDSVKNYVDYLNTTYTGDYTKISDFTKIHPYLDEDIYTYYDKWLVDRLYPIGVEDGNYRHVDVNNSINKFYYGDTTNPSVAHVYYVLQILPEYNRFQTGMNKLFKEIDNIYIEFQEKYSELMELIMNTGN